MFMYQRTSTTHLSQRGKAITAERKRHSPDAVTAVLHRGNNSFPYL